MKRFRSAAVLGFALLLPLSAIAEGPTEASVAPAMTVAANEPAALPRAAESSRLEDAAAPQPREKRRPAARSGQGDPITGFQRPYAFPIPSYPISVPVITGFSF